MQKEVVVLGLGYVGLPSVVNHTKNGHKVIGFDVDQRKVDSLNQGISYLDTVEDLAIKELLDQGVLFTAEEQDICAKDIYVIDVPTPIDENKIPDLSYIESAVTIIRDKVKKGSLIILESTTYPGTTEEFIVRLFEKDKFTVGENLFVAYSPERIDPGNTYSLGAKIPRIVAGHSKNCLTKAVEFFGDHVHPVENLKIAELAKIYENTFRLVNIALADELQKISDSLEINSQDVLEAAATKPFGFMKFTPNLGIGGHCIPVDPYYITWLMQNKGLETPLISTAGAINDSMLDYNFDKLLNYVKESTTKNMAKMKVAILGLSYKKNIADTRMSSVVTLAKRLETQTRSVHIFDDIIHANKGHGSEKVIPLEKNYTQLKQFDLIIYAVNHDLYEQEKEMIVENSPLFYDLTMV
ncbi:nucleotide sugar dehydrogenase [Enterococcus sp. LJL99]